MKQTKRELKHILFGIPLMLLVLVVGCASTDDASNDQIDKGAFEIHSDAYMDNANNNSVNAIIIEDKEENVEYIIFQTHKGITAIPRVKGEIKQ